MPSSSAGFSLDDATLLGVLGTNPVLLAIGRWKYETPAGSTSDLMGLFLYLRPTVLSAQTRWAQPHTYRMRLGIPCLFDRQRDLEQSGGQAFSFLPISRSFVGSLSRGREHPAEPHRTTQGHHGQHGQQRIGRMTLPWPGHVMAMQRAQYNSCLARKGKEGTPRHRQSRQHLDVAVGSLDFARSESDSPSEEGLGLCNLARAMNNKNRCRWADGRRRASPPPAVINADYSITLFRHAGACLACRPRPVHCYDGRDGL